VRRFQEIGAPTDRTVGQGLSLFFGEPVAGVGETDLILITGGECSPMLVGIEAALRDEGQGPRVI